MSDTMAGREIYGLEGSMSSLIGPVDSTKGFQVKAGAGREGYAALLFVLGTKTYADGAEVFDHPPSLQLIHVPKSKEIDWLTRRRLPRAIFSVCSLNKTPNNQHLRKNNYLHVSNVCYLRPMWKAQPEKLRSF